MLRLRLLAWSGVRSGAQDGMSDVRSGAQDDTSDVRSGAQVQLPAQLSNSTGSAKSLIVAQPPRELTTYSCLRHPTWPVKLRCQDQLAVGRNGQNYLPIESAILYRVRQDRWFICAVVGLGALIVVLVAAAYFLLANTDRLTSDDIG